MTLYSRCLDGLVSGNPSQSQLFTSCYFYSTSLGKMGLLHSLQGHPYTQVVTASPLRSILWAFVLTCLITRIITGTRSYIAKNNNDVPTKTVNRISYWIPWVGSAISFARNIEGTISADRYIAQYIYKKVHQRLTLAATTQAMGSFPTVSAPPSTMSSTCPLLYSRSSRKGATS